MSNTINLLPLKTKDQIKQEIIKFKYDLYTALFILVAVVIGVILMFIQAVLQFNISQVNNYTHTAMTTLSTYKSLAQGYVAVDKKYRQVKAIQVYTLSPTTVIDYITGLLPAGATLSNFSENPDGTFTVTIASTDYLSIAKLLVEFENKEVHIQSPVIKEINYEKSENIFNFIITGSYIKNG